MLASCIPDRRAPLDGTRLTSLFSAKFAALRAVGGSLKPRPDAVSRSFVEQLPGRQILVRPVFGRLHSCCSMRQKYFALSVLRLFHNDLGFLSKWGQQNKMLRATFVLVALGLTVAAVAPSQAAYHRVKTRHLVHVVTPAPVRVCDWVGPGGRAVYRCTYVQPQQQSFLEPRNDPAQRTCDWVGPGGRAVYRCR
jgi:hypothetical protein